MLTKEEVKHIADLARIELSEKETEKYQAQLGKILDYMEKLKQVNTIGTPISDGGMIDLENVWREDEISDRQLVTSDKELISMAPEVENGQVKVESVF
ncbi:Asp-tRNA(Asn)/Glu-tRNA(Gln) amidotransferase GatCAB subunit C [Candidatus Kuenenbacteria bacterium CG23_combo_of_CG06-09_8_20_14_all_36_9]|uniref:Aspartyl/glutamyl-tRNA(Asn/Gln) amidotransferase subunit C n=1 Tax=Candidatus Kuenenbacteria bacterium CG10_big_fil_rev_8_21_14_0_10_36_11 TaxID=1974618 RepID=A0A2M6WB54_9BACT|nr:MAG: Asp-tRNA(Asn)/Glu-tRNA(Gln) amidotransferase GatCAB subunit C [Candidatus Kuenenbacteria bacterium CG23_combo_of_CG06-09_8_20_14_all_36_9]PIT89994.1 MAG: Asp-tRNA(Asn)/Glu-tRNA(Gln) amidotransferase GatCAB subunit C [Candidatus Kuenenbacteria bacterium CG10_big_fil_rev_8_21_14_0_10_36_11]